MNSTTWSGGPLGPQGRYEDLVTRDLLGHIEASYRAARGCGARALLGVSMGGYAALRIALKEPDLFAAVAAHSAILLTKTPAREDGAGRWHMDAFHRAFGDPIDAALWSASDPLRLAQAADAKTAPALLFDCGAQDRFGLFAVEWAAPGRSRRVVRRCLAGVAMAGASSFSSATT